MGLCFSTPKVTVTSIVPQTVPVNTVVQTKPEDDFTDMPPLTTVDDFPLDISNKPDFDSFVNNFENIICKTKKFKNRLYIKYEFMDKSLDLIVYNMNDKSYISVNNHSIELEVFNCIYTIRAKDDDSTIIIFKTGKEITINCPTNILIRALSDNFFNEVTNYLEEAEAVAEAEVVAEAEAEAEPEPVAVEENDVGKIIDSVLDNPNYVLIYFGTLILFGLTLSSTVTKNPYDL